MFTTSTFKPAWWLSNPHLQTMAAKLLRAKQQLNTFKEIIELPDNDFVELAWTETPQQQHNKPIALVLHGLEGSVNSHYAKGMLAALKQQGWIGVLMHFRGCGQQINRKARSYHSGDTQDVEYCVNLLQERYPKNSKAMIGFSLGGNVLSKYLAKQMQNPIKAAAIICAPLDLASCSKRISQGFSKVYQKYLLDMLRDSALNKVKHNLVDHISQQGLMSIKSIWEFDDKFTAPLNGFIDAQDYYHRASGKHTLDHIKVPSLIIHAKDDPFLCHHNTTSQVPYNSNITFEISNKGGHVGFISGNNPFKPKFWLEQRVPEFLAKFL